MTSSPVGGSGDIEGGGGGGIDGGGCGGIDGGGYSDDFLLDF